MKIKVIGSHGGVTPRHRATSFLLNDRVLIDAGSVAEGISIEEQKKIDLIFISHAHLDHIKDLAFICDNCFGLRDTPFKVYSHPTTIKAIKDHFMNDLIWPDFSKIPTPKNPVIEFHEIRPNQSILIDDYHVEAIPVNHPGDTIGFIFEQRAKNKSVLFSLDTASTQKLWKRAHELNNLKAIFTEVSFPNHMQHVADVSYHFTPRGVAQEIQKMPKDVPIFIGHIKPNFEQLLLEEIRNLGNPRVSVLDSSGMEFQF